jgi:hypothetical protein
VEAWWGGRGGEKQTNSEMKQTDKSVKNNLTNKTTKNLELE